jgi:ThiF family
VTDYFARVRPLLGDGLSERVLAFEGDPEVGALVVELLASCMLEHVVGGEPFARQFAWKRPSVPLRTSPAPWDARLVARRGPPAIACTDRTVTMTADPSDPLAFVDVSYHVARMLRDATLTSPPRQLFDPRGITGTLGHVLVIGCGSLGSEAVRMLPARRFTLVDDATVTAFNLARQWFGAEDVGRPKVDALADRVLARTWCTKLEAADLPALEALLRDDPPDVAVLATGTHHHAMLAELLWRLGIPHVAACCYPRARYFEVSIISPREHTPCLHCFRGHLYRGPAEPLPDELAAFLYEPVSDRERAQRYTDLVAEPASQIETLRAAHVLARCALELASPHRSPWFARVLAESTTCLLGGNASGAYGITSPGQVVRLGLDDIAGTTDHIRCDVCRREMIVTLRDELPAIDDDADAALIPPERDARGANQHR